MTDTPELFAAATMPLFLPLIPVQPAQVLGRLAVDRTQARQWSPDGESAVIAALRGVGALPVERLLGALELAVAAHDWSGAPDLIAGLPPHPAVQYAFVSMSGGHESAATAAAKLLEGLQPGLAERTSTVVAELAAHPRIAPLLAVPAGAGDEAAIAARHGAGHIALAVAMAGALVEQVDAPVIVDRPAAVVGLAVGAAALLLRETAMPDAYAAAVLAKERAEYLLPRSGVGSVTVAGHRFGLAERDFPAGTDFSGNGLVAVADGGVVVRTGVDAGAVQVEHAVLAEPPAEVEDGWEEIVEVSWRAAEGGAALTGPEEQTGRGRRGLTPPWPGDYRVRVHARDRDEADHQFERHKVVVWAAPYAPETVHRRTDLLGHRLRGEPEPVRERRPEYAYRWVSRSRLQVAATVTVVAGVSLEQALRAFGADHDRPLRLDAIRRNQSMSPHPSSPWISALTDGGHVVLVEENGYRGSDPAVLRALSVDGRAASMFWNVNALTRLSFAEHGEVLAAFEPRGPEQTPPAVARALDGLDLTGYSDRTEKCLVAVERFAGRGIRSDDLARIDEAGVGWFLD